MLLRRTYLLPENGTYLDGNLPEENEPSNMSTTAWAGRGGLHLSLALLRRMGMSVVDLGALRPHQAPSPNHSLPLAVPVASLSDTVGTGRISLCHPLTHFHHIFRWNLRERLALLWKAVKMRLWISVFSVIHTHTQRKWLRKGNFLWMQTNKPVFSYGQGMFLPCFPICEKGTMALLMQTAACCCRVAVTAWKWMGPDWR